MRPLIQAERQQKKMQQHQKQEIKGKKTFSLPKIKTQAVEHEYEQANKQSKKVLKQFHKVKWSIAPRCLLPGHEAKQVLYVCIHPFCKEQTRLVCEMCFFKDHSMHNEQFLAIDEVKRADIEKLRYWPFDSKYRKIFEFITKHESYISNMIQDINATFNNMAMRVLQSIDKMRLNLLRKIDNFYIKETQKQKFSDKVKEDLQQCFELKKISEVVRKLFSKEVRHEVFLEKMDKILQDKETTRMREGLLAYFDNSQKGSDMFFDKLYFIKRESWIIEQIEGQQKSLKQQAVTIEEADAGIQKIVIQTIDYLNKNAEGMYPLTFEKKELEDGSVYNGFMCNGMKCLFGMRSYKNGFVYYGEWKNNAKSGWGVYENRSVGYRYAGQWKQDRKCGYGIESTLSWVYEGNFVADKKEGFGVFMQDGNRLQITWKNDKKSGQGKMIDKNGQETEVYFLNGVESQGRVGKANPTLDLKQLSKKFGSVKSTSN